MNMWFNARYVEDSDRRPGIAFSGRARWMGCTRATRSPCRARMIRRFSIASRISEDFHYASVFWRWNTDENIDQHARYLRMVSGTITPSSFFKALEDAGLAENTIIVYSADNGFLWVTADLPVSGRIMRMRCVPLIICDPRVPPQRGKSRMLGGVELDFPQRFWIGGGKFQNASGSQSQARGRRWQACGLAFRDVPRTSRCTRSHSCL